MYFATMSSVHGREEREYCTNTMSYCTQQQGAGAAEDQHRLHKMKIFITDHLVEVSPMSTVRDEPG